MGAGGGLSAVSSTVVLTTLGRGEGPGAVGSVGGGQGPLPPRSTTRGTRSAVGVSGAGRSPRRERRRQSEVSPDPEWDAQAL